MWVLWNLSPKPLKLAELFVLAGEVFGGGGSYVGYGHRPALLSGVQWNELVWSKWLTDPLTDWWTLVKGKIERERCDVFRKWRYSELSWELSEPMTSIWLVSSRICSKTQYCGQRRRARPAKTCQKIPKKTPLSAESYRRQDWRKYADSRGDPNRSSVAETKTRISEILSDLMSQSHVLKVVENSQCFLILIIPHLLVSTIRW